MLCPGRVVIVTGAGRGIGREHALAFAREGASVVVNDLGVASDGSGGDRGPAQDVVDEIVAAGGEAVANTDDIADWDGARHLVASTAIDTFGGLDVLVNNAGLPPRPHVVHDERGRVGRGHPSPPQGTLRADPSREPSTGAAQSKAGEPVDARIINTSSGAGLMGSVGQGAYSAAKAGIAALTLVEAAEMGRYGVTANAIAPAARTRMTEEVFADRMAGARRRVRRQRPGQHLTARRVARQRRIDRRHRPGVRGRGRHHLRCRRLAARAAGRQGRALGTGGSRRRRREAAREPLPRRRRSTARSDRQCTAAPAEVQARWRAEGAWTDETLLDRLASADPDHLAIVDGEHPTHGRRTCATRSTATPHSSAELGVRPGAVVAWQLPNWWEAVVLVLGDLALRRDRQPDHADACARTRSASSCARPARASWPCRTRFAAPTTPRSSARRASTGAVLAVRDGSPLPAGSRASRRSRRRRSRGHPVDLGHDRRSEGCRAHPSDAARTRPTRIAAAHDDACGRIVAAPDAGHARRRTHLRRVAARHVEHHRGADGHLGSRPCARAPGTRAHRGDDQHAGVHAHDDRPPAVRDDRHARRCACSRSAARAWHRRWCARARTRSTAGASAPTGRRSTRRSPPVGSATTPNATRRPTVR